jgi:hypothetical protein
LRGRQDALGGWARHGRRLARGLLEVLDRARGLAPEAEAWVAVRGRRGLLRLGPEVLDMLGGPARATVEWEPDDVSHVLRTCSSTLRGRGWRVQVQPEARVSAEGVVLADLLVQSTPRVAPSLVVAVRGPHHARRLLGVARAAPLAERLVFVGRDVDLPQLRAAGATVLAVPCTAEAQPIRFDLARLLRDELSERGAQAA